MMSRQIRTKRTSWNVNSRARSLRVKMSRARLHSSWKLRLIVQPRVSAKGAAYVRDYEEGKNLHSAERNLHFPRHERDVENSVAGANEETRKVFAFSRSRALRVYSSRDNATRIFLSRRENKWQFILVQTVSLLHHVEFLDIPDLVRYTVTCW